MSAHDTQGLSPEQEAMLALLGTRIQQHRQLLGLSLRMLAAQTGLSHTYISQIEHGKRNPTILSLRSIAEALQMSLSRLIAPLDPSPQTLPPPSGDTI